MARADRARRSRSSRNGYSQPRARTYAALILLGLSLAGIVVVAVWLVPDPGIDQSPCDNPQHLAFRTLPAPENSSTGTTRTSNPSSSDHSRSTPAVELPSVIGRTVRDARSLIEAAGLQLSRMSSEATAGSIVVRQEPAAGEMIAFGAAVAVRTSGCGAQNLAGDGFVVCIDPGHQARSDLRSEPIGPGSSDKKSRVLAGTTGVVTGIPEYELVLQISMNLKDRLEAAGVEVVMTRTTNDVNVSNAERAKIANTAEADLFIRIHADGHVDSSVAGILTLYPDSNQWTAPIAARSKHAATLIHEATVASTGAVCRGVVSRGDLTGFNHSIVPVMLIECGFMSNPVEDRLLASPHYQDKLVTGMTDGILRFLKGIQ